MKNDIRKIEDQKIKRKGRRPIIFLTVVFVLTWVVLTWFGWNTWSSYQTAKTDKEYFLKTEELCSKIIHLDEVLSMSARMAVVTGNLQWEKRYRIFEPKLDAAIKEAMRLAPEAYIGKAASDTQAANIRLVEMENQSFDLIRQGRIDEAKALLLSDEYEKKKRIYALGMTKFAKYKDLYLRLMELHGIIIHLDEVLSMSARMAVVTGNLQWEKRYRIFEPKLDAAIKEAMRLAPEAYIGKAASDTQAANIRLVEMENQSFDLIRQGRIDEAKALLLSDEYEKKKRIYAQKMIPFTAGLVDTARTNLLDKQRQAFMRLGIVLLLISLLIIVWFVAFRVVSNWKKTLIDKRGLEKEITERKRAEEALTKAHDELELKVENRTAELKKAKEAAESSNKAKSLFIGNMSHELLTPINGIIVSADLAMGEDLSPKMEKIQKTISRSSRALLRTVNTLLDFSKSEDGKLELTANPFRLDEVLGKLSGTFTQKSVQKQIAISFDIVANEVPNALIGDSERLVNIFNLLLDNAAKFSTDAPKVTIGVRDVDKSVEKTILEFYVKDNGIGIASGDFEKIFDAFTQVDDSHTRQYDGTGIGLAVTKRLVEGMGGEIRVESDLGKGSTFYFTASFERQDQEHPFKTPSIESREDTTVKQKSSETERKMGSPELLCELLSTMAPFIQKRKPKQCKEIMAEISECGWPDEYAQDITELGQWIGKYKFKEALPIYESTMKKLKS